MKRACAVAMVIVVGVLVCTSARGSGVHIPTAVFVADQQPEPPLDKFVAGHLGVIQPTWETTHLYVVYRYLAGPGFDPDEQKVMITVWNEPSWPPQDLQPQADWITARAKIPGAPDLETFEVFAAAGNYDSYRNCNDNAFRTATATLQSMVAKFGDSSPQVKKWLDAQDIVFQNCPGLKDHPHIPPPLKAGAPFEQAQRRYQIASANFYGENFDAAISLFNAIALDATSPWRTIAPYLVARATIRKATLSGEKNDNALLAQAEKQLNAIATGKAPDNLKASARGLLGFIGCRLHPEERHAAEVRAIMGPHSEKTLAQDLKDFRECGTPRRTGDYAADDLDDWLDTFKSTGRVGGLAARIDAPVPPRDTSHLMDKWKRTGSMAWLVAALAEVSGADPNADALLKAAERVKPNSPAYMTVEFHVDRILIEQGKADDARARLDAILAKRAALTRSDYNQFAWMRLKLARNLDEYLRYAMRPLVGIGDEGLTFATDTEELKKWNDPEPILRLVDQPLLDYDSVTVMNAWLPLSVLTQFARSPILPPPLRAQIALSVWVRSVLLGDEASARELAPVVSDLMPALKPSLDGWLKAKSGDDEHFELALMMLRNPGMRPYIDSGLGRLTPLNQTDALRDNFWSAVSVAPQGQPTPPVAATQPTPSIAAPTPAPVPKYPTFLSDAERKSADREWTTLSAIGGPEFLCTESLRHARANPNDERVPESLYRCISAVHLSQASERCNAMAASAFHLLHSRYPNGTWAQKNRFWYRASGSSWEGFKIIVQSKPSSSRRKKILVAAIIALEVVFASPARR